MFLRSLSADLGGTSKAQFGKAGEVSVEGNQLATMLDSERGEPCIRNEIAICLCRPAKLREYMPMIVAGMNQRTVRLL